ncbi:MAG: transcriptional regulator [Thermodesulfobacteriota bacterium]
MDRKADKKTADRKTVDRFVESWGMMGSVWGTNTSMARVHALLIVTEEPLSLDDIAKRLKMSRGNASMCLRELRNWTVVRLMKEPGDRQDYYVTEPDIWKVFVAIVKERKRREFDPVMETVREALPHMKKGSNAGVNARLKQMEEILATLDTIGERFLADEDKARYVLSFLSGFSMNKGKGGKG